MPLPGEGDIPGQGQLLPEAAQLPDLSLAALPNAYPGRAESLLHVLQRVSDSIEEFDQTTRKKK